MQHIERLAKALGPSGATVVIVAFLALVAFCLLLLYMWLSHGERPHKYLLAYLGQCVKLLVQEIIRKNKHPAVWVEIIGEFVLAMFFFASLGVILVHAPIPWISEGERYGLLAALLGALFCFFTLARSSVKLELWQTPR